MRGELIAEDLDLQAGLQLMFSPANHGAAELAYLLQAHYPKLRLKSKISAEMAAYLSARSRRAGQVAAMRKQTMSIVAKGALRRSTARFAKGAMRLSTRGFVTKTALRKSTLRSAASHGSLTYFALYLNSETFVGKGGELLASHVRAARATGIPVVLAHETDPEKKGCEFSTCACASSSRACRMPAAIWRGEIVAA